MQKIAVHRQPVIPEEVKDFTLNSEGKGRIWFILSAGDGVERWAEQMRRWGMPAQMVEESKPHSVELWREVCPHWNPNVDVQLEQGEDGLFYWIVYPREDT